MSAKLQIIFISGIPGSGKTTEADRLAREFGEKNVVRIAVNDFYQGSRGFHYVHAVLRYAQEEAKDKFESVLKAAQKDGTVAIIVEDLFTCGDDFISYMNAIQSYALMVSTEYETELITMVCDPATAIARQVHDILPGYIVHQEQDLRERVIVEAWWTRMRTVKVPPIEYPQSDEPGVLG